MNWAEFFAMGGYGVYVWSSYAFSAAILIVNVILPLRRKRVVRRMLRELAQLDKGNPE